MHNGFIEIRIKLTSDLKTQFIDKHKILNEEILYSDIFIHTDVTIFLCLKAKENPFPISEI